MLRQYIRVILEEMEGHSCPVRNELYGGMPSMGGYSAATEYEIGAGRMAEAAHCLLGSLGRHLGANRDEWNTMIKYEREHIHEELGIIEKVMGEYSRDLYSDRLVDFKHVKPERVDEIKKYAQMSVESIRENSPKLAARAQSKMSRLQAQKDMPKHVYEMAYWSYQVLIELARAMGESVEGWPEKMGNAYKDPELVHTVKALRLAVDTAYEEINKDLAAEKAAREREAEEEDDDYEYEPYEPSDEPVSTEPVSVDDLMKQLGMSF